MQREPVRHEPALAHTWRTGFTSRFLAAALYGVATALDVREREVDPQIEEAPEPSGDDWLVLLDREDPARSLVIIPSRVVAAAHQLSAREPHA